MTTSFCTAQYKVSDDVTIVASYQGGAYVELGVPGRNPVEVINVWDYKQGEAVMAFNQVSVAYTLRNWVREYADDGEGCPLAESHARLEHDVLNNWYV